MDNKCIFNAVPEQGNNGTFKAVCITCGADSKENCKGEPKTYQGVPLKNLRIVEIGRGDQTRRLLGTLSSAVEYRIANPNSERPLITYEEIYTKLREIVEEVKDL